MLKIKDKYKNSEVSLTGKGRIITLNDRVTQRELQLLHRLRHPAVYVAEKPVKKPAQKQQGNEQSNIDG